MPRIPKKVPAWLGEFAQFARGKEKQPTKEAIGTFEYVLDKRWEQFVALNIDEDGPEKKKRKTDPLKSLQNALNKVLKSMNVFPKESPEWEDMNRKLLSILAPALDLQNEDHEDENIEELDEVPSAPKTNVDDE